MHEHTQENVYSPYQWRSSPLSKHILSTKLPKKYIFIKMSLNNYDSLANSIEHVQEVFNSLELVIQDHDLMCKILHTTFKGSTHACYNKLEPYSIEGFNDLCAKLVWWQWYLGAASRWKPRTGTITESLYVGITPRKTQLRVVGWPKIIAFHIICILL